MNCKPGDLAWIVSVNSSQCKSNIGKIVKVCDLWSSIMWNITSEQTLMAFDYENKVVKEYPPRAALSCEDKHLRPFRNPGDDEQDESKSWLPPVPSSSPKKPTPAELKLKLALKLSKQQHTYSMAQLLGVYPA